MRTPVLATALSLQLAAPAMGQDTMAEQAVADARAEEFSPVAPDSNWFISSVDCRIDGGWGDDIAVTLIRHDDHHDLSVYDPALKRVKEGQMIPVRFGAGGRWSRDNTRRSAIATASRAFTWPTSMTH